MKRKKTPVASCGKITGIQITTFRTFFFILDPPVYLGVFPYCVSISKTKINFETKKNARANVLSNKCYNESGKSFFSYAVTKLLEVQFVLLY